jgi:purine-binding chemotaxis protein CheW
MHSNETFDGDSLRDPDLAQPQARAIKTTDYFVFRLHARTYAVPPSSVESVAPVQRIVPVPTTGAHVRGVVHSRGRIIAVIDLAALLGIDDQPQERESARMIVVSARYPFAFIADATLGIWACADHTRSNDDGPIVIGRIENGGEAATVIDAGAVIDRVVSLRTERP